MVGLGVGCASSVLLVDGAGGSSSTTSASMNSSNGHSGSTSTGSSPCDNDTECPPKAVCIHSDGLCGKGVKGQCDSGPFPFGCPALPQSCRCDGTVSVVCGGADVAIDASSCSKGTFACGPTQCKQYIEYCIPPQAQAAGGGPFTGCVAAPATCFGGIADCNCIMEQGGTCTDDYQGGVTFFFDTP